MFVLIRADSSTQIGAGHVMRCLTLANELKSRGADIMFVCRDLQGNLSNLIENKGFQVSLINSLESNYIDDDALKTIQACNAKKVDWCIVDNYNIDEKWHKKLKEIASRIFVIDDLPDRKFCCDILLDQTYGRKAEDYSNYVPETCELLLGSKYALLREEFFELNPLARDKRNSLHGITNIMVSMGAMDPDNNTSTVLNVVERLPWKNKITVHVVISSHSPIINDIEKMQSAIRFEVILHKDSEKIAELMLEADLAIGAGGTTSWERCCLGLPSIAVILAENQRQIVENLEAAGAVIKIDKKYKQLDLELERVLMELMSDDNRLNKISKNAFKICDGHGATKCAERIYSYEK